MNKHIRENIHYCLKYIDTLEYKEFVKRRDTESLNICKKYIAKEHPAWISRTDFYTDCSLAKVYFYDVLSNKGIEKLLRKLHTLPKRKYKVQNYYKKPTFLHKYDYVHLQYSRHSSGLFSEIKIIDDEFIDNVNLTWSQINGFYALSQYEFIFKYTFNDERYDVFLHDKLKHISSKDYFPWYYIKEIDDKPDYFLIQQMRDSFFPLIFQHFITTKLYSELGRSNPLIHLICYTRKAQIDIDTLYLDNFGVSYYNKADNYVISRNYDDTRYILLSGNNTIPAWSATSYISSFGCEFYYRFAGDWELKIFENTFSKFYSGRKPTFFNKDFLSLTNKMQGISETKFWGNRDDFIKRFNENWDFYVSNDLTDINEFEKSNVTDNFKQIYKENYEYLKLCSEMNYTKITTVSSIIAIVVALLSLIISCA